MNVSTFDTRLPMASLLREAREFFATRNGLAFSEEGDGVLAFTGESGTVRLSLTEGGGTVHVAASTEGLDPLLADFRERVAPPAGRFARRRLASNRDLERFRRLSEKQAPPPTSTQAGSASFGGGLNPG